MPLLGMYEEDYRKREIERYVEMLDSGKVEILVPTERIISMLAENLQYRVRLDYLTETVLRHNFSIPQAIVFDPSKP